MKFTCDTDAGSLGPSRAKQHKRELIISLVLDQDNKLYLISLSILITCLLDDV